MNQTNLIPPPRRRAKARSARLRNWIAVNVGYAMILAVAGISVCAQSFATRLPSSDLAAANHDIDQAKSQLAAVRLATAHAQQLIASAQNVSQQPDWSRLLGPLAASMGDDILLSQCDLAAVKKDDAATKAPPTGVMTLHLVGLGRSQTAVAQFVLRLEVMGLFEHVTLQQSSREQFMEADAVKFELICPLRGRMGATP